MFVDGMEGFYFRDRTNQILGTGSSKIRVTNSKGQTGMVEVSTSKFGTGEFFDLDSEL